MIGGPTEFVHREVGSKSSVGGTVGRAYRRGAHEDRSKAVQAAPERGAG